VKITVVYKSLSRGNPSYEIDFKIQDDERRDRLIQKISKMASRQLGNNFVDLGARGVTRALLRVTPKTSSGGKRLVFRQLLGWIALCDSE
jgi:hypothetical protein